MTTQEKIFKINNQIADIRSYISSDFCKCSKLEYEKIYRLEKELQDLLKDDTNS